eukprot:2890249-Pyramimonas_sp.AAC.1
MPWGFVRWAYSPGQHPIGQLSEEVRRQLPNFMPRDLARTLGALASLGHHPGNDILSAITGEVVMRIPDFQPQVGNTNQY